MGRKDFSTKFTGRKKNFSHHKQNSNDDNLIQMLEEKKSSLASLKVEEISKFDDLPISKNTLKGLNDEKFTEPTKIQRQSLPHSLASVDVVAEAKTGSGKTLAFIIPLLEKLYCQRWSQVDGLGALVITPTRELAYQILEVINKVGKHHKFSVGLIIGGKDLKYEWSRIGMCNIMICTPGRFLQHMTENPNFKWENLQVLVLDEADQCLSMGFADTMNIILEQLPSERQTLLFSATQTRDVKDLIRAGCKDPIYCSAHEYSKTTTPKSLKESYVICDDHDKVTFIYSFLKNHLKHKILIFLSTCKQVRYLYDIFCKLQPGLTVMGLHGDMHQLRRMSVYDEFCKKKHSILFATDVAARGLDIPTIDWVIQADCPEDVTTYIHRAGRTARHIHGGEALLLLSPSQEKAMVFNLRGKSIPIERIDVDPSKLQNISSKIEFTLTKYANLRDEAQRAFKAYLKYFSLMKDKKVFDVSSIDLDSYARSLGLKETPRVRFIERKLKNRRQSPKDPESSQISQQASSGQEVDSGESDDDDGGIFGYVPEDSTDFEFLSELKKDVGREILERNGPNTLNKDSRTNIVLENDYRINSKIVFDAEDDSLSTSELEENAGQETLEKDLGTNDKVLFDTEGKAFSDLLPPQQTELKECDEKEAITENEMPSILHSIAEHLQSEDLQDKEKHKDKSRQKRKKEKMKDKITRSTKREEKLKLKNDEAEQYSSEDDEDTDFDSYTQTLIDDLPDPDRLYNNQSQEEKDDEDQESGDAQAPSHSKSEMERFGEDELHDDPSQSPNSPNKIISAKRGAKELSKKAKKARLQEQNDISSLDIHDKEALALYLLKNKR